MPFLHITPLLIGAVVRIAIVVAYGRLVRLRRRFRRLITRRGFGLDRNGRLRKLLCEANTSHSENRAQSNEEHLFHEKTPCQSGKFHDAY